MFSRVAMHVYPVPSRERTPLLECGIRGGRQEESIHRAKAMISLRVGRRRLACAMRWKPSSARRRSAKIHLAAPGNGNIVAGHDDEAGETLTQIARCPRRP